MWMVGATNANRGATDADGNKCSKWGATNAKTSATNADGNKCSKWGATNARLGVHKLCLGARRAGDSNTKWRQQGVLGGAHNLLENGQSSTKPAKRVY